MSPKQVVGFTCVFNSEIDQLIRKFTVSKHTLTPLFSVCADLIDEWGKLSWSGITNEVQKPPSANKGGANDNPPAFLPVEVEHVPSRGYSKKSNHRRVRTLAGSCDLSDVQEVRGFTNVGSNDM